MSRIKVNNITAHTGSTVSILSDLNLKSVSVGTSVNNLGIDASGKVIIGTTGGGGGTSNISDSLYTVNNNLNANLTTTATTSICIYGVNVFTGVTNTDLATKLPQPVTGKSVKIINNGSTTLAVFPSNIGGKINNLPINAPVKIPADGKIYEFICIVNPLPGNWSVATPLTSTYDSGVITVTVTGGTGPSVNQVVSAFDASNVEYGEGFNSWNFAFDGKNKPLIINNGTTIAFKPSSPWLGISKITVYTNIINDEDDSAIVRLLGNGETDYYDLSTDSFIANGASASNISLFDFGLNKRISGTSLLTGYTSPNVGDIGTQWGEKIANTDVFSDVSLGINHGTLIGGIDKGSMLYPYGGPYSGKQVNGYYTSYISFQIRPLPYTNYGTLTDFKFKFIIEFY